MNVFVLCTGRCGSTTFVEACRQIRNFTRGHESRAGRIGADRLAYPDQHIEADNRLAWFLGRLELEFPDAFYVHLTRDRFATAASFARRYQSGIIAAYRGEILMGLGDADPLAVCLDYVDTVTANVEQFLRGRYSMRIALENVERGFRRFWNEIGAVGNLEAAIGELAVRHNASTPC